MVVPNDKPQLRKGHLRKVAASAMSSVFSVCQDDGSGHVLHFTPLSAPCRGIFTEMCQDKFFRCPHFRGCRRVVLDGFKSA